MSSTTTTHDPTCGIAGCIGAAMHDSDTEVQYQHPATIDAVSLK